MIKLTVQISNKELDALEDLTVGWNLCDKHKAVFDASEEDNFGFTQTCKDCVKINGELRNKTLHLWSKLVSTYQKSVKIQKFRELRAKVKEKISETKVNKIVHKTR